MRLSSSVLVLSLLVSCGAAEPENCTVTENADGSATITCPDGSTVTIGQRSAVSGGGCSGGPSPAFALIALGVLVSRATRRSRAR